MTEWATLDDETKAIMRRWLEVGAFHELPGIAEWDVSSGIFTFHEPFGDQYDGEDREIAFRTFKGELDSPPIWLSACDSYMDFVKAYHGFIVEQSVMISRRSWLPMLRLVREYSDSYVRSDAGQIA